MTGVSASPTALVGLRPEPASGLGHTATITNAALRQRLLRKAELLTRRHSEMAAIDAPALDRLGWMKPYRDACNVVFKRLHEIGDPL